MFLKKSVLFFLFLPCPFHEKIMASSFVIRNRIKLRNVIGDFYPHYPVHLHTGPPDPVYMAFL